MLDVQKQEVQFATLSNVYEQTELNSILVMLNFFFQITTAAVTAFLATLMYMSSGCWMIKLLIEETDVDKSAKVYVFYGFNMTSSILGFLFAGLAAAVGWSVREQLCTRRTNCTNTVCWIASNLCSSFDAMTRGSRGYNQW